ncbi:MAG TPA: tetratricopeptide repeat protein, partial [Burkholderiaceae bacterium]
MSASTEAQARPARPEVEALVALFGQRRYGEAEQHARALTSRYPQDGFGWKALGAVLKQQRRLADAIAPLTRAAELMGGDAEAHYNLGTALLEQGRLEDAVACYRTVLALNEHYLPARYNLANACLALGRLTEAETAYRAVLQLQPELAEAWSNLSVVLQQQGRRDEAEQSLRQLLKHRPRDAQAWRNLAIIEYASGRYGHAERDLVMALSLDAGLADAETYLGHILTAQERAAEGAEHYRRALQLDAANAEAHNGLGVALRKLARAAQGGQADQDMLAQAEASHRQALTLRPAFAEARCDLGNVLREQGRAAQAEQSYREALRLRPDYAEAHYNLGNVYKELSRLEDAEASYRAALAFDAQHAKAHNNLGNTLKEQSRLEEAAAEYAAAIALKPDFIESHYALAPLKTYLAQDPHLDMLEQLRAGMGAQPVEAQIRYWFTVGKAREDVGDFDAAFAAYRTGNGLKAATLAWDEAHEDAMLERMTALFSKEFFAARPQPVHEGRAPIFIVGMPRSGTSLLEQILASCPGVHGAGERPDLSEVIMSAMPLSDPGHFPEAVADFPPEVFRRLGEQYNERLWSAAPQASRITDKMPANFFYIGMIHLMLPQAKIIHAMRDPMDSCLSCYSRLFEGANLAYSYDLGMLGRYYSRYIRLMRHWHAMLPQGTILDMPYEAMVADTEGQARRLLDYLGLPWDARCM